MLSNGHSIREEGPGCQGEGGEAIRRDQLPKEVAAQEPMGGVLLPVRQDKNSSCMAYG
jgi:hypothetical protein